MTYFIWQICLLFFTTSHFEVLGFELLKDILVVILKVSCDILELFFFSVALIKDGALYNLEYFAIEPQSLNFEEAEMSQRNPFWNKREYFLELSI